MTNKTTMPEPVAEIQEIAGIEIFDLTDYGKECGLTVGQKFITTDQAEAYADARVREELGKLDDQIDLQCSKLQTDDETHDFWMGVGAAVTVAQNVIADSMPDDK